MNLPIFNQIKDKYNIELPTSELGMHYAMAWGSYFEFQNIIIFKINLNINIDLINTLIDINRLNNVNIIKTLDNNYYLKSDNGYIIIYDINGYRSFVYNQLEKVDYDMNLVYQNIGTYLSFVHQPTFDNNLDFNELYLFNNIMDFKKYEDVLEEEYKHLINESIIIIEQIMNIKKDNSNYGLILDCFDTKHYLLKNNNVILKDIIDYRNGFYLENLIDIYYDIDDMVINHNKDYKLEERDKYFNIVVNAYKESNKFFKYTEEELVLFKKYHLLKLMYKCMEPMYYAYDELNRDLFEYFYDFYMEL